MARKAPSSEPIPFEYRDATVRVWDRLLPTERRLGIAGHYFKPFMANISDLQSCAQFI